MNTHTLPTPSLTARDSAYRFGHSTTINSVQVRKAYIGYTSTMNRISANGSSYAGLTNYE